MVTPSGCKPPAFGLAGSNPALPIGDLPLDEPKQFGPPHCSGCTFLRLFFSFTKRKTGPGFIFYCKEKRRVNPGWFACIVFAPWDPEMVARGWWDRIH